MFSDAFVKIENGPAAEVLDALNPVLKDISFDTPLTHMRGHTISIYKDWLLIEVNDYDTNPVRKISFLYGEKNKKNKIIILDGTEKPIQKINALTKLSLEPEDLSLYIRFYFEYVIGQFGKFKIVETVDAIDWLEEPTFTAKKAFGKMVNPLRIKGFSDDGSYKITACIIFKNALFETDFHITKSGNVTVAHQDLLVEDLPILDNIFNQ